MNQSKYEAPNKLPSKYVNTGDAAELLGLSEGYMAYLRTDTAKAKGHVGPPFVRVDMRDGTNQPRRIKYDREAILKWKVKRQAELDAARPTIQHVAG